MQNSIKSAMTLLSIAASGIIAVAAAVFAFSVAAPRNAASAEPPAPSPHRRADQRGITLQTLIVMAVLVLIAAGVSVVLVGITRGANDNLGDAGKASSEAKCEPWELYDPNYAALGIGGPTSIGGVQSSKIGCVRVCFIRFGPGQQNPLDSGFPKVLTYEDEAMTGPSGGVLKSYGSLEFYIGEDKVVRPTRNLNPGPLLPPGSFTEGIFAVASTQAYEVTSTGGLVPISIPPMLRQINEVIPNPPRNSDPIPIGDLEIRVADDLRSCVLRDPANGKEIFRSQGTI